jgi:hypothetical protein
MSLKEISQSDLPRELVLDLLKRRYAESAVSEKRSKQTAKLARRRRTKSSGELKPTILLRRLAS